ncbi:hypothetical protein [Parabacteroides bouchesdurhonensis]|uniref:hypothetical protein n=1 Tax=Parabacteroides bouchesdurhonensis TaxID=1936995 RepID=UPI000C857E58|nr:hypothetical protein [Parabacteroides bouchesdurhonensis]RHJ94057.1 hypothetical protein DW095_03450 [Bacteroides sp. AM07-16]
MMIKTLLILLAILSIQLVKAVELEPRIGLSCSHKWGLQTGALLGFKVTDKFFIQPGVLLYSGDYWKRNTSKWDMGFNIPVYASFRLPVSEVTKIRLNAGPYLGIASLGRLGVSAEAGIDIKKVFVGIAVFQNCITDKNTQLGASIGYRFSL